LSQAAGGRYQKNCYVRRRMRRLLVAVGALVLVAGVGCGGKKKKKRPGGDDPNIVVGKGVGDFDLGMNVKGMSEYMRYRPLKKDKPVKDAGTPVVPVGELPKAAMARLGHGAALSDLVFAGSTLLSGGENGVLRFWSIDTKQHVRSVHAHKEALTWIVATPDCSEVYTAGSDATIAVWNVATGEKRVRYRTRSVSRIGNKAVGTAMSDKREVDSMAISPDGTQLILAAEDLRVVDRGTMSAVFKARIDSLYSGDVSAMSIDGKLVRMALNETIYNWDLATGEIASTIVAKGEVMDMSESDDRRYFAVVSGSWDGDLEVWFQETNAAVPWVETLGQLSDEYDTYNWDEIDAGPTPDAATQVALCEPTSVRFAPGGKLLAIGCSEGMVRLRNPDTGDLVAELTGHNMSPSILAFNKDGTLLASGDGEGVIIVWPIPPAAAPRQ
jgi:WD40 repeat protein